METWRIDEKGNCPEKRTAASSDLVASLGYVAAWVWALVAGGGGLLLLLTRGPLPLTNGWFALFSGLAVCPLTATVSQRYFGTKLSARVRIATAVLFFIAGRVALVVGNRVAWLSR